MREIVSRTSAGRCTYASVVISPKIVARPVVTIVSHATRDAGSFASSASTTASEIWSATLSGWPSVTDSDVKKYLPCFCMWFGFPRGRLLAQVQDGGLVNGDVFLDVAV